MTVDVSVWDLTPHPWVTFADLLRVDDIFRRQDAMWAIRRWPGASVDLVLDALAELADADRDAERWDAEMDRKAANWETARL